MRANITFDTLEYKEELKRGGMTEEQALSFTRATVRAFDEMMTTRDLATKKDLTVLKTDLQAFIVKAITTSILILSGIQTFLHYFS